jgi:hypothetical protein
MEISALIHSIIDWIQDRMRERTSWDGLTIIIISILALVASPIIRYVAWAGLAYGIWTLWRGDKPISPGLKMPQPPK